MMASEYTVTGGVPMLWTIGMDCVTDLGRWALDTVIPRPAKARNSVICAPFMEDTLWFEFESVDCGCVIAFPAGRTEVLELK